jgi:hypothetical protein
MPFVNPQKLSLQFVLEKLEHFGSEDIPIKQSPEFVKVKEKMEQLKAVVASSEVNVLLKDL